MSNSPELLKPNRVTDTELQNDLSNLSSELQNENQRLLIELGNLKDENEKLRADYDALLESSTVVTKKLREEVGNLQAKLTKEEADRQAAERKLEEERKARQDADRKFEELQENSEIDFDFAGKAGELVSWLRKTVGKALPKQVTVKEIQKILEGGDN